MSVYGYIRNYTIDLLSKQLAELKQYGCDHIVIEADRVANEKTTFTEMDRILKDIQAGDELVVGKIRYLEKTIVQISDLITLLRKKGASLVVLEEMDQRIMDQKSFFTQVISDLAETEKRILSERTKIGLERTKKLGKKGGGRPKISEEKIYRINYLYTKKRLSLREIATECDISIGTAHKYVKREN